jgi:hypothetical protein
MTTITVHEPQIESWDGHFLRARQPVVVMSPALPRRLYGVIAVRAAARQEETTSLVFVENVQVLSADFPAATDRAPEYLSVLRAESSKLALCLPLDGLRARVAVAAQQVTAHAPLLGNAPPQFIVSTRPAILVRTDGLPVWRLIPGTGLRRAINTSILLLKEDSTGWFYLHVLDLYMQAPSLEGPWEFGQPVGDMAAVEDLARDSMQVDLLEGQPDPNTHEEPSLSNAKLPAVYVSATPAELVTFNGQPDFVPVPSTRLLCATNTTGNVFRLLTDGEYYILMSGRWFRSASLDGPWRFVPGSQLPPDFAAIPDSDPRAGVKASVPGTRQAAEASIANTVPQTTKVPRAAPMQTPRIDGPPQLKPIEGTSLHYVANSGTPIVLAEDQSWYACRNGVWFVAASVQGPWAVAVSVPPVVYSIPTTSSLHYLTHAQIYNSTADAVEVGYTPGYLGTEVEPDGTVVFGTGYDYSPWIGQVWYGPPVTWGLGCDLVWTAQTGWRFGFGFGWDCGYASFFGGKCRPPAPWWTPYRQCLRREWPQITVAGPRGWLNTASDLYARTGPPQLPRP